MPDYTRSEFAFLLKQQYPELREFDNDTLVDRILRRRSDIAPHILDDRNLTARPPEADASKQTPLYEAPATDEIGLMMKGARMVNSAVTGAAKQVAKPARHAIAALFGEENTLPRSALEPSNTAEKVGGVVGEIGQYALAPEAAIGKLPFLARTLARGAVGAGIQAANTGEVDSGALATGAVNAGAGALGDLGKAIAPSIVNSMRRSILNILQPKTKAEQDAAFALADRVIQENLAPALSSREKMLGLSKGALANSTGKLVKIEGDLVNSGAKVDASPVYNAVADRLESVQPSGHGYGDMQQGRALVNAAKKAVRDTENVAGYAGMGDVDLKTAITERSRLDKILQPYHKSGNVPPSMSFTDTNANAWRDAINNQYPALAKENLRNHELIKITELMQDALQNANLGAGISGQEAGALGAAGVGSKSRAGALVARLTVNTGPWASASAQTKRIASRLLASGEAANWMRLAATSLAGEMNSGMPRAPQE